MSRFRWSDIRDAVFPAAGSARTIINSGSGKLDAYGDAKPADGLTGYAPGCTFKDAASGKVYINKGSNTSCEFKELLETPSYGETAADRGPSPLIWDNCPIFDYEHNPVKGMHYFTDFLDGIVVASAQSAAAAAALGTTADWAAFTNTNPTITTLATNHQGVVRISTTDDNTDAMIAYPQNAVTAGMFKFVAGKKLWMEMRIAQNVVGDSEGTTFFGFAEEGLLSAAGLLAANEGQMVDKDWVGFERIFGDGDALDTRYNTESSGSSPAEVGGDAVTTVAGTFIKLGIYCDGTTCFFFGDGVLLGDSVAIATTGFPIGEELAIYLGVQGAVGDATVYIDVDWVRVAQEY